MHDLPTPAGSDGLDLSDAPRARILLGSTPPARLRVFLRGEGAPGAALFANGTAPPRHRFRRRRPVKPASKPSLPPSAEPAVLGLAVPERRPRAVLTRLELLP